MGIVKMVTHIQKTAQRGLHATTPYTLGRTAGPIAICVKYTVWLAERIEPTT